MRCQGVLTCCWVAGRSCRNVTLHDALHNRKSQTVNFWRWIAKIALFDGTSRMPEPSWTDTVLDNRPIRIVVVRVPRYFIYRGVLLPRLGLPA